ncbi:hypothetical protein B0O99DRAFT_327059 [Bisporella sp. PMI_857]|nr:hypothetical protein B0O99DRAFT_365901 [Bisporella sp. PMI_857]KAH8600478.1 hypothetical protein B0O99DRAFT_327059 [Bisporella sp. PMI_857]
MWKYFFIYLSFFLCEASAECARYFNATEHHDILESLLIPHACISGSLTGRTDRGRPARLFTHQNRICSAEVFLISHFSFLVCLTTFYIVSIDISKNQRRPSLSDLS